MNNMKKVKRDRTLIVPDIHNKVWMFDYIRQVAEKHAVDKLVFVGDYFDDWSATPESYRQTINQLLNIKDEFNCEFLLGNHDASYIINRPQHYSSPHEDVRYDVYKCLQELKPKIATTVDDFLVTHAGLGVGWTDIYGIEESIFLNCFENLELVKQMYQNSLSPLQIRPNRLLPDLNFRNQIVGHTPVSTVSELRDVYYVDTFSTSSNMQDIGDKSLLLVDNGHVKTIYYEG